MAVVSDTQQICRDFIQTIVKADEYDSDFTIQPISTEGANYTSHLFLTTLSKNGQSVDLFAKVAAVGEKLRKVTPMRMYDTENYFYTNIVEVYRDLEEKNSIPHEHRLNIPKFYACNPTVYEETLVLENLAAKGFTTHDRFNTVDWSYASSALTELAKFHALSIAFEQENPEKFQEAKERLKLEFTTNAQHAAYFETVAAKALSVTKEENKVKLREFFDDWMLKDDIFLEFLQPLSRAVITHGDYRPSNMMHKQLQDSSLEVVPVDFQTIQVGCPITDLLYFIFTSTDEQFRLKHYEELVHHYHGQLSDAMRRLALDPEHIYSHEVFEAELKERMPYGLSIAALLLPIVTVEAQHAPTVGTDMDLDSFSMKLNEKLFPERFNGVVDDYVRWGLL